MSQRVVPKRDRTGGSHTRQRIHLIALAIGLLSETLHAQWIGPVTDVASDSNRLVSVASNGAFAFREAEWTFVYQPNFRPFAVELSEPRIALVGGIPGEMGAIAAYNTDTQEAIEVTISADTLYDVALVPSNNLAFVAGHDGAIHSIEWPSLDRSSVSLMRQHNASARGIAVSPNGQWLASCALDGLVALQRVQAEPADPILMQDHTAGVEAIAFSPDGQTLASSSTDGKVRLHNLQGRLIRTYSGMLTQPPGSPWKAPVPIRDLTWTTNQLLAGAKDGSVYQLSEMSDLWTLHAHAATDPLFCMHAQSLEAIWIGSQSGAHRLPLDADHEPH